MAKELSIPACTLFLLLVLACICCTPEALVLRYRLPHGSIRKVLVEDNASVKDLHELLRSMSVLKGSNSLVLNAAAPNKMILNENDSTSLCSNCIPTEGIVDISSPVKPKQWGRKISRRQRPSAAVRSDTPVAADLGEETEVTAFELPVEAMRIVEECAEKQVSIGIVAGSGGNRGVRQGAMVFQVPFPSPNETVSASHIAALLENLKDILLVCRPFGYDILGFIIPGGSYETSILPRYVLISLLAGEFIGATKFNIIRASLEVSNDRKAGVSRRLMSTTAPPPTSKPSPSLSVDAFQLTTAAHKWAKNGFLPNYFSSPGAFLAYINNGSLVIKALRPIQMANQEMVEIDPILFTRSIAISTNCSNFSHNFPAVDMTKQNYVIKKMEPIMGLRRPTDMKRLKTVFRDPHLLLFLLRNYYSEDINTLVSMCKYLSVCTANQTMETLQESSFLISIVMLRNMILESVSQ